MADQVLRLIITANTSGATKEMRAMQRDLEKVSRNLTTFGTSMSTTVSLPILAAAAGVTKLAMDAVESENLFEVSMGGMADDARKWSESISDSLGLNEYAVRKNVGTFNVMLDSMGLGKDASYDMAKGLTQLAYDMASFYNLKPEEAFEKLQSGISGEVEPLKRLGIIVNETTAQQWALTHGIIKQGETMTEAQKVQARYGAIMDQTAKAQGDLARTIDSPTNKLRVLKEQGTELAIEFGMALIPTLEGLVSTGKDMVEWLDALSPEQQKAIVDAALLVAAVGPLALGIGKVVGAVSALHKAYMVIRSAKMAESMGEWSAAISLVSKNANSAVGDIAGLGSQAKFAAAGYVALAAAAGFAIGSIINQIPEVAEKQQEWGDSLGELVNKKTQDQVATDEVVAKWKAMGIALDENNNLTDVGRAQLAARSAALRVQQGSAQGATQTEKDLGVELADNVRLTQEVIDKTKALNDSRDGSESASIRYERAQLRLGDAEKAYNEAIKEHGSTSREAKDAELDLRQARLDLKGATEDLTTANDNAAASLDGVKKVARPQSADWDAWVTYYTLIGDAAGAASARINAANSGLDGRTRGKGGTNQVLMNDSGGIYSNYAITSLVEDGVHPESVISWDPSQRTRSLGIWAVTGNALGANQPAQGGNSIVVIADPRYTDMAKLERDVRRVNSKDIGAGDIAAALGI